MIIVFLALLMASGVLFGTGALVVDVGYGMGQQAVMQNSADAAALAAAKILASSVGNTDPYVLYVASDSQVNATAMQFATYNRSGTTAAMHPTYATAVEYLKWDGSTCVPFSPPYVTVGSTPGLVPGGAPYPLALSNPAELGNIPPDTCAVRVYAKVTYDAMLAHVPPINAAQESATATATAQVLPAQIDASRGLWPTTHWVGDRTDPFKPGDPPVTFWDSNEKGFKSGDWKLLVDLSRYSALVYPTQLRPQVIVAYDHTSDSVTPHASWGNTTEKADLNYWFKNGWAGKLKSDDGHCSKLDPKNLPSTWNLTNCTNSRLEVYPHGDGGANVSDPMRQYIDNPANTEGVDTSGQGFGKYATLQVFLWRYGEIDIDVTTNNSSRLWDGFQPGDKNDGGKIQRVIVDQVKCFRFYDGTVDGSQASGYYVSCPSNTPTPGGGRPTADANFVALVN